MTRAVDWPMLAVWLVLLAIGTAVSLGALYGLDLVVQWVVGALGQ